MVWFLGVLIVLVVGAAVVVAVGRGGGLQPVYDDRPDSLVPADAPLTGADLRSVRFSVGFRGYRMDEVDALLARLAEQLDPDRGPDDVYRRGAGSAGERDTRGRDTRGRDTRGRDTWGRDTGERP